MANCSYTIDGKTYSKSELKAWLYDGGLEQLYPDGMSGVEPKQDVRFSKSQPTTGSTVAQITSWLPKRVDKMLDAGTLEVVQSVDKLPANLRQAGNALFHTVFHGTPHDFDRFSLDKIGSGEGAQAFGYGLYFTDKQSVAEWYRDKLSPKIDLTEKEANLIIQDINSLDLPKETINDFEDYLDLSEGRFLKASNRFSVAERKIIHINSILSFINGTIEKYDDYSNQVKLDAAKIKNAIHKHTKVGKLYQVELAPQQDEYLDWDKPLSEQSDKVKDALSKISEQIIDPGYEISMAKLLKDLESRNVTIDGNEFYRRMGTYGRMPENERSKMLHEYGIRGIRYKAEGGKSDASNYVIFNEDDISITAKYSQLSGIEALYDPDSDTVYLVADMLNKVNLSAVLSHELLHRGLATDSKLKDAYDRFQSDMQRRFSNAAKGIGTKADKDAYARVLDANTPEKDRIEEFGAYMVSAWQKSPDSVSGAIKKAIQDFIAAIRAFLVRNGLDMGFIKSLTPADLMVMSRYGANTQSGIDGVNNSIMASIRKMLQAKKSSLDENGVHFETNVPVTFNYAHNTESATNLYGKPKKDSQFGRYYEPSAQYVIAIDEIPSLPRKGMEYGTITFNNPLVIENDSLNWKEQLSKSFGGKRGKALSKALIAEGYDGIVTTDGKYTSEIINLTNFDEAKAKYSIASKTQALLKDKQSKFDTFIHQLQDRYIDLKRQMEKVVRNGGKITANPYQAEELYHQRAASRIKDFNEKELTPILQGLHDNEISMDDFQKFLHARHAESRNAVMAERNPSQAIIDAKLSGAEAALDALDGSDKKAMREAQKEVRKWRKAKPFNGTEEERLSLSGMSNQDARDFIAGLPADKAKAMSALGDKIDRITNKTLDLLVNYGMETQETVDALKAQWEHYVPLHRDEAHPDNNGQPIGRGFSVRGSGLKTATGSNAEVTNILAHLAAQREQMIRRGEKNRVSNILAEFIKQHPDDEFATVDKVEMQDSLNDDGLVEGRMEPFFKRSMKDNVVMFRKDGKDHAITFNDRREDTQRLAMSLKNMDAGLDAVESIFAKGTRWMAAVNTQYNIVFGLFNLARDAQGMALNMSTTPLAGKQKQVFSHLWRSIKIIYGSERNLQNLDPELKRYYDAFNKAGGTTGYSQMFDDIRSRNKSLEAQLKDMGAGKGKKLLMAAKQWVSDYNSVMENATRLSVFIEAKNQGLNNDEAASIAKNITVNFNRKGSYTTKVGALYAFFNASMQGTARLAETMKGPKGKQILAGGVLAGAVSTILGMMVMGDDEWEKIPEFVRERSLIIPTSKTGYITLPMPLGFHILPNIGRKVVEMVAGSSKVSPQQRLLELVAATAGAFNPLGGGDFMQIVTPTVIDPMVDLARNKDWTGKPIYREDMNSLNPTPGFTRTKDTATSGAKMAAYAINKLTGGTEAKQGFWSPTPDQIDYLLGQILGGTGREVSKVWQTAESAITGEELPAYKRPLVGRLYGETKGNAAEKGAYYDNVKRLNEHEAEIKWLRENKQSNKVSEYLRDNPEAKLVLKANGIESSIRKLKSIHDKLEGAGANKQRLTAIDTQIVSQMKRLNDAVSNVNH